MAKETATVYGITGVCITNPIKKLKTIRIGGSRNGEEWKVVE